MFCDSKPLTLFCFPCAGASATTYIRWRKRLPDWINVEPVELPGRGSRITERLIDDYETLVDRLSDELSGALPANYAFFGHSMGALLAYGCAHRLRDRRERSARALLLACCAAPTRRNEERLARLQTDDALLEELKKMNGTPVDVFEHPELLRMTLDLLGADVRICASFRPFDRAPLDVGLHVFGGLDDEIEEERLAAWSIETSAAATLEMFDGGHFFIRDRESDFLAKLRNLLRGFAPFAERESRRAFS
ncbi:thioesterase [Methylosinus sp. H3A]|uniref:thioesterase II family protein n=1 Tax=Methylosinus sp. H3A TaxID=2785786 RepID=UPI0018C33099|nr:alpha/beta fold hydrolase [Methylosinus sp. H3A]MBG0811039.1 thioesterase [Methylosinus sp. H3A]